MRNTIYHQNHGQFDFYGHALSCSSDSNVTVKEEKVCELSILFMCGCMSTVKK